MKPPAKVAKRLRANVSRNSGISNETLERFCFRKCSDNFKGVFSADYIPNYLAAMTRFILIANLGTRRGIRTHLPVGHFVTIVAFPNAMLYIDSYGLPSVEPHVNQFLKYCRRDVWFNLRPIQRFNSNFCALYAMLFTCFIDKIVFCQTRSRLTKLQFKNHNLRKNDDLCLLYLKRLFEEK